MFAAAGSLLDGLAAAVENAKVVLVCCSTKYKESRYGKKGYFTYIPKSVQTRFCCEFSFVFPIS